MNPTKKSVVEPFDQSSFIKERCYLYDGYFSHLMATPAQIVALAAGMTVINIVVSKN